VDLSKFFDEVNHDVLMAKVKRVVSDKQVLKLIDRYLRTGIMHDGVASPRSQGTPQGSPLSPLLSNILLNDLDKELERRGHSFCRYADDSVPRTQTVAILFSGAAHKMRDGPSEPVYRHRLQTTLCCIN